VKAIDAVRPNSIVLDIGANFGAFSLRLASYVVRKNIKGVHIHAFEPNPVMVSNISQNLALNPELSDIVTVHPFGLGKEKGKLQFRYEPSNSGAGRIVDSKHADAFDIEVDRVDDIIPTIGHADISFIKLIVEGFEPQVFEGAVQTIEKYKPPIFFEVTPHWYSENGSSLADILSQLQGLGYSFYGELHNEMVPYSPERFDGLIQYNMFAVVEH
jgi:FkbM family methyltransferase